jgi:hypothetical protein
LRGGKVGVHGGLGDRDGKRPDGGIRHLDNRNEQLEALIGGHVIEDVYLGKLEAVPGGELIEQMQGVVAQVAAGLCINGYLHSDKGVEVREFGAGKTARKIRSGSREPRERAYGHIIRMEGAGCQQ